MEKEHCVRNWAEYKHQVQDAQSWNTGTHLPTLPNQIDSTIFNHFQDGSVYGMKWNHIPLSHPPTCTRCYGTEEIPLIILYQPGNIDHTETANWIHNVNRPWAFLEACSRC